MRIRTKREKEIHKIKGLTMEGKEKTYNKNEEGGSKWANFCPPLLCICLDQVCSLSYLS
jgi:hypothetical protein